MNYTARGVPYTRIIEHKHFEFGNQPTTVITYEYPETYAPGKEPYYPVNDERNTAIFKAYQVLANQQEKVIFGGRLGGYTYADMDDTIEASLHLAERVLSDKGCE